MAPWTPREPNGPMTPMGPHGTFNWAPWVPKGPWNNNHGRNNYIGHLSNRFHFGEVGVSEVSFECHLVHRSWMPGLLLICLLLDSSFPFLCHSMSMCVCLIVDLFAQQLTCSSDLDYICVFWCNGWCIGCTQVYGSLPESRIVGHVLWIDFSAGRVFERV